MITVVGHEDKKIAKYVHTYYPTASLCFQEPRLGTAHAAMQSKEQLEEFDGDLLILYGNMPFLSADMLNKLQLGTNQTYAFLTDNINYRSKVEKSSDGLLNNIITSHNDRYYDADPLCYSGIISTNSNIFFPELENITNKNDKSEYYLHDYLNNIDKQKFSIEIINCVEYEAFQVSSDDDLNTATILYQKYVYGKQSRKNELKRYIEKNKYEIIMNISINSDNIAKEIEYLKANMPNDAKRKEDFDRYILFLNSVLSRLDELSDNINASKSEESLSKLDQLAADVDEWYSENRKEVIDTAFRVPAMAGTIGLLSLAGAAMGPATIAAIGMIGGPRLVKWYKKIGSAKVSS